MFENLSIKQAHEDLKNNKYTSVQLTQYYLDQIKKKDPELKAFVTVCEDKALEMAKKADEVIASAKEKGEDFPLLTGIPFTLKDSYLTEGIKTTASSHMLEDFVPPYSATIVERLYEQNAVLLGKVNLDAWGHGSSTENSDFFTTRNPYDTSRVAGGSSGGSGASVAADMALFSIGEDTGGSGRLPAAFCGVFSLKPTYGRIPRYGCISLASSLDTVSPMTRHAEDSNIVFNIIKGADGKDQTVADQQIKQELIEKISKSDSGKPLNGIKIGLPKEYFVEGLSEDVKKSIEKMSEKLKSLGAEVKEISLPHTNYGASVYYIVQTAETSSNLNRYDGIRYGYSDMEAKQWDEKVAKSREKGMGDEAKRRILLGTFVLSSGYFDAYYLKAQKVRKLVRQDYEKGFEDVDAILSPVSPSVAFKIGENTSDPLQMYLEDVYTIPANLAGVPSFAVPADKNKEGLPIGVQFIGPHFSDEFLMKLGDVLEKN